jgi:RNA polymerase sigma factor (sigma-70 family)
MMMENLNKIYREHYSKMVSALVRYFGLSSLAAAEDIVQDTFIAAFASWSVDGEPDNPTAWLFKVCKNKALNYLKSPSSKVSEVLSSDKGTRPTELDHFFLDDEIKDSQLRLLFACCDQRLSPKSQIILILKNLCGLKVQEIANALLMNEEAVTKSMTRSKHTIVESGSLVVPSVPEARSRLSTVHTAIYLLFSEGYAATEGDSIIRRELCVEAMRLIKSILDMEELRNHDTYALMALMCFHSSRFEARIGAEGELMELEKQDRTRWDRELIRLGIHYLKYAHDANVTTRYVLEAAIASVHAIAEQFEDTNWKVIAGLYERLADLQSTPFVDLNRAVALFYASGPDEALHQLTKSRHINWLRNNYLYYALLGKIYAAKADGLIAISNYEKALSMCTLRAEQDFLRQKIVAMQIAMN